MGYSSSWHDQNRPTPPPLPEDVTTTQYVLVVVSCLNCKVHLALFQINNDDLTVTIRITMSFEYFKSGLITIDLNKSHFRISLSLNEKSNCLSVYLGFSGKRILLHFSIYAWQTTVRVLIVIMNMDSAGICKSSALNVVSPKCFLSSHKYVLVALISTFTSRLVEQVCFWLPVFSYLLQKYN